jgi:hypothetical protein
MLRAARSLLRPVLNTPVGRSARPTLDAAAVALHGVQAFDRPGWLLHPGAVPRQQIHYREANPVSVGDVALCERLIAAYTRAQDDAPASEGMWTDPLFVTRQRELVDALERKDARALAERLAAMFRSDFVIGMAAGSLGLAMESRFSTRFAVMATLSKLASLAESQGVARMENPEQGDVAVPFEAGVENVVVATEATLGVSLDFPAVGAAYGLQIAGRLLTADAPDQIYAAARLRDAIRAYLYDRSGPLRVVEIGGGYGGMAYWLVQMLPVQHVIVDLPSVNVMQGYFLAQALGHSEVSLYGEETSRVSILPTHALPAIAAPFDVLANKDSMPEIPEAALLAYLEWARVACDGIFYSYNQEAAAPFDGIPQNVVPEVLATIGGFEQLRRDTSWLRRGYAEEIYRVSAPA